MTIRSTTANQPTISLCCVLLTLGLGLAAPAGAQTDSCATEEATVCHQVAVCRQADAEVAFVRGLQMFRGGCLEEAASCFDRAVKCFPQHGSALFWRGVTHLRAGEPRQAAERIAESLSAKQPPRADRGQVLAHLDAAERAVLDPRVEESPETIAPPRYRGPFWPPPSPYRWEGRLGLSAGYDTNPNLLDAELVLRTLDGELIQGAEADSVQDLGFRLALYRLPRDPGGWSLGWTLEGGRSFHRDFDFLDLGQGLTVVHAAWGRDPLSYLSGPLGYLRVPYGESPVSVLLQAGYLHTRLDGETYFQGAVAGLSITVREARFTDTRVDLAYQDLGFEQAVSEDRDRSGSSAYIDVSQAFYMKRRDRYLRLGLAAGERDAGRTYARSLFEVYGEASLPVAPGWSLLVSASLRRDDFDHPESNLFLPTAAAEPREDTTTRVSAALVWSLRQQLKLFASLGYADRRSELVLPPGLPGLGYDRTRSSVGILWFFGSGR